MSCQGEGDSESFLGDDEITRLLQSCHPFRVGWMTFQERLHVRPQAVSDRLDMGHGPATANNRYPLALVLDGVEQLCKIPCSIGCTDLSHKIRLSDYQISV